MKKIGNKIIDIDNHILPLVDDGSIDMDEAISSIKYLQAFGVTDIILTSHYIANTKYEVPVIDRKKILKKLQNMTEDIDINLYLGNEVHISDSDTLIKLLNENKITTLNQSRYLLIEFPKYQDFNQVMKVICDLNDIGIVPIISHAEKYRFVKANLEKFRELKDMDCLFMGHITSIINSNKRVLKKLLKKNMIDMLASNFHHRPCRIDKALKKLRRIVSNDKLEELLYKNPKKVLDNKKI